MSQHAMPANTAAQLLATLGDHGVDACVGGGWAVDALVGRQTRDHEDLDLWVAASDLEPLFVAATHLGLDRILPWPGHRPWNFALHDGARLRLDLHFYEPLAGGQLHFGACMGGKIFAGAALAGRGAIGGHAVRCEAPEWALLRHTGYPPRPVDRHDVALLCERFALGLPEAYH
jgi:lincosamide nucleotidyltransferase A/C/D/E